MTSLQDLIKLCGQDSGKIFVVNDVGDIQLVIMGTGEYQKMLTTKIAEQLADIEQINQEIIQAQLQSQDASNLETQKRQELFRSVPGPDVISNGNGIERHDMRSEVIDPTFNFDAPDRYSADQ